MKIIAVYPGRFQPFHKGHAQVYKWLKEKFGNAHIATSDKVEAPKSPFNFDEKKTMMELAGVSPSDISQVRNPYIATEILKHYDGSKTVLVFAISEKDMAEDPRFSFKPTKSGKPGYLQPWPKDGKGVEPFGDPDRPRGYVVVTPTFTFNVLGEPAKSATEVRKQFANADHETQKKLIKDLFGKYDEKVHKVMDEKIKGALKAAPKPVTVKQLKSKLKEEAIVDDSGLNHEKFGPMLDTFVKFASKKLGIQSMPNISLAKQEMPTSFGGYSPQNKSIVVVTKNRHPMDVYRTVAHELVHHKQNEDGLLGKDIAAEGSTGSDIENDANSKAGVIMRWFAKKNPNAFKSGQIVESVNNPSRLKAVFLAGGPGSGKDFIMNRTLQGHGLKEINSDTALEHLMKKKGLSLRMPPEERTERDVVRGQAKTVTKEKQRASLIGRQGLIINGTADDPEKLAKTKQHLEDNGYDTMMVYVNTSDKVSRERNIKRGEGGGREVSEDIRKKKWEAAQAAKGELKKLFGADKFIHVDNSEDYRAVSDERKGEIDKEHAGIHKQVRKFVSAPTSTAAGQEWEKQEREKRGITVQKPVRATTMSARPSKPKPQPEYIPNASEIEQAKRLGVEHLGGGQFGVKGKGQAEVSTTHVSKNGQLTTLAEDKRMKNDPCWKGYKMIGKKKKAGKEVPNCVPVDEVFEDFLFKEEIKKKIKLKKKLNQEDNSIALGYEFGNNGIGDEFGVIRSPNGLGMGYSLPMQGVTSMGENWEALGGRDMGTVAKQNKEELPEQKKKIKEYVSMPAKAAKDLDPPAKAKDPADLDPRIERDPDMMQHYRDNPPKQVAESSPAWQRSAGKNPEGGLNRKGIASYRAEHPGSKLSLAVTEKPSKLKPGSKKAKRRLSFCRRMKGMKAKLTSAKTAHDPNSRINKSLRKWNCEE